jgi:hypothetical protein
MPTLIYSGGPQNGHSHRVPGKPPSVRHWASPGERANIGWLHLHRYVFRQCVKPGTYTYEYTGVTAVDGPRPAKGVYGGEVIEGWE